MRKQALIFRGKGLVHRAFPHMHDWVVRPFRTTAPGPRPWVGTLGVCRSCGARVQKEDANY